MEEKATPIEMLFDKMEDYGKTTFKLVRLKTIDASAEVVSSIVSGFVVAVFVALFVFVFSVGASLYIGNILGAVHYGFFSVAGLYMLLGLVVYLNKKAWLIVPVRNLVIKQLLKRKMS